MGSSLCRSLKDTLLSLDVRWVSACLSIRVAGIQMFGQKIANNRSMLKSPFQVLSQMK